MVARPPAARRIVGRDTELAELGALLGEVAAGRGAVVLVEGEAGIGKSSLLAELARRAASTGWQVARGQAWHERDAPPYWPWTQVIRELRGTSRGTELGRVVLDDPSEAEQLERFELFDAACDVVMRAARRDPVVITLDDLHAADPATAALTRFVASQLGGRPVLIAASYRVSEIERRPDLRSHLEAMASVASVVSLGPLGTDAVAELLADLGGAVEADLVHAVTGGHPLFVQQVLRSGQAVRVDPAPRADLEHLTDPLREAIRVRLHSLDDDQRWIVAAISVIGHGVSIEDLVELLRGVHPLGVVQLEVEIASLVELGLVERVLADDPPGVRMVHALVADEASVIVPSDGVEQLHARAAMLVGDDPERSGERARHLLRAGPKWRDEAVKACVHAAEHAVDVLAHEQAVTHYQHALDVLDLFDLGEPDGGALGPDRHRDRRRLDVVLALGATQRLAGRPEDSDVSFDRASDLADRLDDPVASATAALRGGIQVFFRAELETARLDRMRSALGALAPGDHPLRARLLAELAAIGGTDPAMVAQAAEAVAMARRVGDPTAIGCALVAEQVVDLGPATLSRRLATAREILVIARRTGDTNLATHGRVLLHGAALENGDLRGVDQSSVPEGAGELLERSQARLAQWMSCTRAMLDGRASDAERIADETLAAGLESGDPFALRVFGGQLGVIRRLQGRLHELEPIYEAQWRSHPDEAMWPAALAVIWAGDGRHDLARGALDAIGSVDRFPGGLHWLVTAALTAEAVAVVGHDDLGPQLWHRLIPLADRMVPINLGAAVFGPVGLSLGRLGMRLGHVDRAIGDLERAVTVCARLRARPWLAESQIELARALIEHRLGPGVGADGPDRGNVPHGGRSATVARVSELLHEAEVTAAECGLERWVEVARDLRGRLDAAPLESASAPSSVDVAADVRPRPSVSVLGAFEVTSVDGRAASWSSRKARELLKILVSRRGAPVHREVLMGLLWPNDDPASVGNRLSVALWTVRRALDPDRAFDSNEFVAADRQTVRLRVDTVDVDVERFLEAAVDVLARASGVTSSSAAGDGDADECFERLVEVAAMHRGPALPDEPYAEWAAAVQREVHLAHTRVLGSIAEIAVGRGDDLAAADAFRGLIEADPFDRATHEGLVAALERVGATAMADVERRRFASLIGEN